MSKCWSQLDHSQSIFSPCKASCLSNQRDNCPLIAVSNSLHSPLNWHSMWIIQWELSLQLVTGLPRRLGQAGRACAVQDRADQQTEYFPAWQASPRNTHTVLHPQKVAAWPLGSTSLLPVASGLLLGWETTVTSSKKESRELGGNSGAPLKEKQIYRDKDFQFTISLSAHLFSAPKFSEQISSVFSAVWPD